MALIIPSGFSTFGDSTKTEGPLQKYILAQFRSDSELDWIGRLRAAMVVDEIKYGNFTKVRPRLRSDQDLWARIEKGIAQATIIVIDPKPIQSSVRTALTAKGAIEGQDFGKKEIVDRCATAIINGTPVAYLPSEMARIIPWNSYEPLADFNQFTSAGIRAKIGDGLVAAQIFAARAYATFDVKSSDTGMQSLTDVWRSPLAEVVLAEVLATERVFDTEHPRTAEILNEMTVEISNRLTSEWPLIPRPAKTSLIKEVDSRAIDHLQAADLAAGWAREMLETGDARSLGTRFERVWVNGQRIK